MQEACVRVSLSRHVRACPSNVVCRRWTGQADIPLVTGSVSIASSDQARPDRKIGDDFESLDQLEDSENVRQIKMCTWMHSNPLKGCCNIWQPVDNRCVDWLLAFFQVMKCMQVQAAWGPWHVAPSCRFSWWLLSLWFLHLCHARHLAVSPTQQQPLLQRASCHCLWCSQLWQRRPRVEGFWRLGKLSRVSCNGIMQDYMMPPSWPFLLVFGVLAFALLVAGNFIFPGKKWKDGDEDSESLEVKLIFCLWSANQLQIRDLSLQFLAEQRSDFKL